MRLARRNQLPLEVRIRAPAKINWTLSILGRREDGYHEIDSVMQAISLADRLRIWRLREPRCEIRCSDPSIPTDERNLIHQAWVRMRGAFRRGLSSVGIVVDLEKNIPVGAGLGGGSSDAAATLLALNRLWGIRLSRAELAELAASIGSDVPFFLHGGAARCLGRGEIVQPIASRLPPIHLVVVYPGFPSSTADAYARLKPKDFGRNAASSRAARALAAGKSEAFLRARFNAFDRVLTEGDERCRRAREAMMAAGLDSPLLSGSGSACFAVARDRAAAVLARRRLLPLYPQAFAVRTLRSAPKIESFPSAKRLDSR